jgi:hypothetical protein
VPACVFAASAYEFRGNLARSFDPNGLRDDPSIPRGSVNADFRSRGGVV